MSDHFKQGLLTMGVGGAPQAARRDKKWYEIRLVTMDSLLKLLLQSVDRENTFSKQTANHISGSIERFLLFLLISN